MTMLRILQDTYRIGSERDEDNPPRDVSITEFWLSDSEVMVEQFLELLPQVKTQQIVDDSRMPAGRLKPVSEVTWFDAVRFCNPLSDREGLQHCYTIQAGHRDEYDSVTNATVEIVAGNGYRLPT